MRPLRAGLLALWLAVFPLAAEFSLTIGNVYWQGGLSYNPFDASTSPYAAAFTVIKNSPGKKSFFVTLAAAPDGTYNRYVSQGSQKVSIQCYTDATLSGVWKDIIDAAPPNVIAGELGNKGILTADLQFFFQVPQGQLVAAGDYTQQYRVSLYSGSPGTSGSQLEDSKVISLNVRVEKAGTLAIVPSGSGFLTGVKHQDLDFGVIDTAHSIGCDILVKHTSSVRLEVASENLGRLKLLGTADPDYIPYLLTISGNSVNMAALSTLQVPNTSVAPDGDRLPVLIRVPALNNPAAGQYRDDLTVTLYVN